jgi:hypothetical protein
MLCRRRREKMLASYLLHGHGQACCMASGASFSKSMGFPLIISTTRGPLSVAVVWALVTMVALMTFAGGVLIP